MEEDMAVPDLGRDGMERVVLSCESGHIHVRRSDEPSVQAIRPAVVRALDSPRESSAIRHADPSAAMPADIEIGPHGSTGLTNDDYALAGNIPKEVIARVWNRVC